jgi:pimeloyl-ACP methyl ester carboxylesterase
VGAFSNILSWILCILFLIIAILMFGMGGRVQSFLLLGIVLILFPPFRAFLHRITNRSIPWWVYLLAGIGLWSSVVLSFIVNPATSIYKSEAYHRKLIEIYDAKLAEWPVPYKVTFVETQYGKIHVIISGPEDAPPVLLINASALSGWSWIHNVEDLNQKFRTFAIDNIGEGGKNEMLKRGKIPKNGKEIAEFYSDISDKLGISKSFVVGASIGGYISTNYALYAPERVEKLVLLGPMGFGSTYKTIIAMTIAQGLPIKPIQDATFRWAFGDAPHVIQSFGEWFRIYMKGLVPTPIVPSSFTSEQLKNLRVPTLAFFGTKDGVIGNAQKAKNLAENIPDAQIEIVESGHVMGAELPEIIDKATIEFFQTPIPK